MASSSSVEEYYMKASNAIRCALSFEENENLKTLYEMLNTTYECKIAQLRGVVNQEASTEENMSALEHDSTGRKKSTGHHGKKRSSTETIQEIENHDEDQDEDTDGSSSYSLDVSRTISHDEKSLIGDFERCSKKRKESASENSEIESFIINNGNQAHEECEWEKVVGLEHVLQCLREATILPQRFPQLFSGERRPWRAVLLYGPPGTGKTMLASTLAKESLATFFSVSSADILSKWVGQSERKIKQLFDYASKRKPSVIFIDEVDSLCSVRNDNESETSRRIKTEFLVQMQGVSSKNGVTVVGATNLPWEIDIAIRRRFEKRIYVPLPDKKARKEIIVKHIGKTPNSLSEEHIDVIASKTEGYSGSDISVLIRQALLEPIRKCQQATHFRKVNGFSPITSQYCEDLLEPTHEQDDLALQISLYDIDSEKLLPPLVTMQDFEFSLSTIKPTLTPEDLEKYEQFSKMF
ncbi:hypothetical protein C9374_001525 [Naegleria lovaniensis]|uniref:AAA+ ATPase domain-containing protein n=1 Tax=Naegleria lovaniensis TaxID=51637 RepID=A0AA88GWS7_NAELO|nr:uncharacterized protein C9374_001525 [Naegleria lovaniensis]KAG2387193.1 hypothetical protein C9374_001525 [Naegleria lovaniensis]